MVLFGNSFGRFVVKMAASLVKFTTKLLTKVLPGLLRFIAANPALAALAGVTALGVAAVAANQKGTAVIKDPDNPDKSQMDETREFGGMSGDPFGGLFNGGGQVPTKWFHTSMVVERFLEEALIEIQFLRCFLLVSL